MTNLTKGIAVAAIALALPLTMGSSANAAPLMAGSALSTASGATVSSNIIDVQWRRHGYYRRGGYGWGGVGAGLAAGALIGGAIAASQNPYYGPGYGYAPGPAYVESDSVAYCMQRYKSYDPRSGTYLNYDGNRYPCP